jgi:hypothetical protein
MELWGKFDTKLAHDVLNEPPSHASGDGEDPKEPALTALRRASNFSASAAAHRARFCTGRRRDGSLIVFALSSSRCASARHARGAVSSS